MCEITGKHRRFIDIAKKAALKSLFDRQRHGAVLVKGGSVIKIATNSGDYCSFGDKFRSEQEGPASVHAELGCILGVDKSVTQGATVYVVRINNNGEFRLSKPCPMCEAAMRYVGIKKVYYSLECEERAGLMKY